MELPRWTKSFLTELVLTLTPILQVKETEQRLTAAIEGLEWSPAGGCVTSAPINITGSWNIAGLKFKRTKKKKTRMKLTADIEGLEWSPAGGCVTSAPINMTGSRNIGGLQQQWKHPINTHVRPLMCVKISSKANFFFDLCYHSIQK